MPPLLVKSGIHFGATASSKEEAVALCGQALVSPGAATHEYAAAMWEREQIASSYLGNFVAMPHDTDLHIPVHLHQRSQFRQQFHDR